MGEGASAQDSDFGDTPRRQNRVRQRPRRRSVQADTDREPVKGDHRHLYRDAGPRRQLSFTMPLREAISAVLQAIRRAGRSRVCMRRRSRNCWSIAPDSAAMRTTIRSTASSPSVPAAATAGVAAASTRCSANTFLKDRLARHPGGRYSYSNTGYEILTAIIEEQTGRSYEDYCSEAVFGQLGIAKPKLHPDWRMLAGSGWLVHTWAGLSGLPRHLRSGHTRFLATTSKPGSTVRKSAGRPTATAGTVLAANTWAGGGRWTVSHGGHPALRAVRTCRATFIEGSIVSHAFRAADGTAVFIALEWSPQSRGVAECFAQGDRGYAQVRQNAPLNSS